MEDSNSYRWLLLCYGCGGGFAQSIPSYDQSTNNLNYILHKFTISKSNLNALFLLQGHSNSSQVVILGKVYTVNSIVFHAVKLAPIGNQLFSGSIIFKEDKSDKDVFFFSADNE